ncbi:MAG: response regulator [Sphingomonadaceae bacterium]|nr:response regulator [Sphingomonadaceae bacterium]
MGEQCVVAIIDDDEAGARSAARLIEQGGYRTRLFESGDAFLAAQGLGAVDCILLDLRMPGTDGLGVLRALAGKPVVPPVVVLTGHGAVADAVEAMKLGAMDFLEKPYRAKALLAAIRHALMAGPQNAGPPVDADAAAKVASLPPRQVQVLEGIVRGLPNKLIAHELDLSIRTVEAYRAQLLERLGARGTAEAVRIAIAAGMLPQGA